MKHEWKKLEKDLYLPKQQPTLLTVPKLRFIVHEGFGNPNSADFADKIQALYALAYTIKMLPKKGYTPTGYFDYTVYPLEGIWDLSEKGKQQQSLNKNELVYQIMIRQPDFVDQAVFELALKNAQQKKPNPLLAEVEFKEIEDGPSLQMLHLGSYDNEPVSFALMKKYLEVHQLQRRELRHREIYLSDARKVAKDKLKTVLRYFLTSLK